MPAVPPNPGAAALAAAPRVVLGTASSGRRAVFDRLASAHAFSFAIVAADIDEKAVRRDDPADLVRALAAAKAAALVARLPEGPGLLVTADQVVTWKGAVREKPVDAAQAASFLADYCRGPAPATLSALAVTDLASRRCAAGVAVARVTIAPPLTEAEVAAAAAHPDVLGCAGGLMIERPQLEGRVTIGPGDEDSVRGLPVDLLWELAATVAGGGGEVLTGGPGDKE
jgi:septum formation protein